MARQHDFIASLGAAHEVGELSFCIANGNLHGHIPANFWIISQIIDHLMVHFNDWSWWTGLRRRKVNCRRLFRS